MVIFPIDGCPASCLCGWFKWFVVWTHTCNLPEQKQKASHVLQSCSHLISSAMVSSTFKEDFPKHLGAELSHNPRCGSLPSLELWADPHRPGDMFRGSLAWEFGIYKFSILKHVAYLRVIKETTSWNKLVYLVVTVVTTSRGVANSLIWVSATGKSSAGPWNAVGWINLAKMILRGGSKTSGEDVPATTIHLYHL